MASSFVLKGTLIYAEDSSTLKVIPDGYLVCENGISKGVYETLPERFAGLEIRDYGDRLIIPGLVDLHVHAPQYAFRGLGMDLELLDWLKQHAFPEEIRYADLSYAEEAYRIFSEDLKKSTTSRACIFATSHREATELLMDLMEESGLCTFVGKSSMDRNCPDELREDTNNGLREVSAWLDHVRGKYTRTYPILTPRFVPACSDPMLEGLGKIRQQYQLPVQSHLSENQNEVAMVKKLCPWAEFYGDVYDRFGLFGGEEKAIMVHCVWSVPEEIDRIRERGVFVAHCPESNMNLLSGIAPIRTYLDAGIRVGLGSDVAGGSSISLFRAMMQAVQVSKLYWRLQDTDLKPLTLTEAFWMATKGGGAFFGKVGSFEEGYELDALILDDREIKSPGKRSAAERLEQLIYLNQEPDITAKYVAGRQLF